MTIHSIAERLKHAREIAGLSQPQVSERTGIGVSSISEIEQGKRDPSISQVSKFAEAYSRSAAFFFDEQPIEREPLVLWRQKPQENAKQLEATFLQLCRQFHNLEVWCNYKQRIQLPFAPAKNPKQFTYSDAEELAKRVRKELELGTRPAEGLPDVLEEVCGVKIFHLPFEPSGPAASVVSGEFGVAILLNTKNKRWRRHFDLAHELFHILTWDVFHSEDSGTATADEMEEKLADSFASHLLMPEESFRTAVNNAMVDNKLTFERAFDIAHEFDVSIEAFLWRFHWLYRRKEHQDLTRANIEQARKMVDLYEQRTEDEPPHRPDRYHRLAVTALRRGELSVGRFAQYLGITRHEASKYVSEEHLNGEEIQATSP